MNKKVTDALETLGDAIKGTASAAPTGDKHLVVLDRGWIFYGSLSYNNDTGTYTLSDCKNVRYFKKVGFGGLTKGAKKAEAVLDACEPIVFKESAMIFKTPVKVDWDA